MQRDTSTRRNFSLKALATVGAAAVPGSSKSGNAAPLVSRMGIASTSFMGTMLGRRSSPRAGMSSNAAAPESKSALSLPPTPHGRDTMQFLEKCHALGAAGVQTQINGDPHKVRARAEELGMWVEAMVSVRNSTPEHLEQSILNAKEAGCTLARDGLLGGRRYETFHTLADWNAWVAESRKKLETAIPIFEKHKFTLALENHKDWTAEQYIELFKKYQSEYFGACLDFGNNISLLDGWMETIEAAAQYTKATHFKDMGVMPYADGFLLSEVPLGTGVLDLPKAVDVVRKANPNVRFSLEMITRDPLQVSCLTDHYWITFPERNGLYLARTLRFVTEHKSKTPLPTPEELPAAEHARVEEENIRACFRYVDGNV
jgi:3-oxoisoapionate decarboxylase